MKRTKREGRKVRQRILILCEGQTEKNYFQGIKEDPEYKHQLLAVHPEVIVANKPSPELVVKESGTRAHKARKEYLRKFISYSLFLGTISSKNT